MMQKVIRFKKILSGYSFLITVCLLTNGCARLNAIHTLAKLGRNERLKAKTIQQESMNFQRAKNYMLSGKIQTGISKNTIVRKLGRPVVILPEPDGESWAYKPGQVSWLEGEKIYLIFQKDGKLNYWDCVNLDCPPYEK